MRSLVYLRGLSNFSKGLNLQNISKSLEKKPSWELARAIAVLVLCRINAIAQNGERLAQISNRIVGKGFTNAILRASFFGHFCGGQDEVEMEATAKKLLASGLTVILSYTAEGISLRMDQDISLHNYDIFMRGITTAAAIGNKSFIALKLTALFDTEFMEHLTTQIEAGESTSSFIGLMDGSVPAAMKTRALLAWERVNNIARQAERLQVRLLLDAEQQSMQAAVQLRMTLPLRCSPPPSNALV